MSLCGILKDFRREVYPKQVKPVPAILGGNHFDLYYWTPEEDHQFHAEALTTPKPPKAGIAWAERDGNDVMFQSKWLPPAYRVPGTYSTKGLLDALESKKQKELFMHEAWGHMLKDYGHDEGHAVMDGTGDGHRVPLGKRVSDESDFSEAWGEIVNKYPNVRIIDWVPGMTWKVIDEDDVGVNNG